MALDVVKHTPPVEKTQSTPKAPAVVYGSASSDRPYACPYEGCGKAYIHEYKLNLHLRREHPGHNPENGKQTPDMDNDMDEASDQDAYTGKGSSNKNLKRSMPKTISKMMPPSKVAKRKTSNVVPMNLNVARQWHSKDIYEDDSEETEEEHENVDNNEDDEETEYED